MCLFPKKNNCINIKRDTSNAYVRERLYNIYGISSSISPFTPRIQYFDCGYCPECLGKRSSYWALRAVMQARESKKCCMVTLTYDTFKYDKDGNIIGENLNLRNVDKRDCQLFIKRLREHFKRVKNIDNIKYLLSAEYGKRTGRPHYHALLFGVEFNDLIFHKKSKRGNTIYRSPTLSKLWKNGICTVDSVNMSSAIAKYCTKYAMKDAGIDDTFMLVSSGIGVNKMLEEFNGLSYFIEGQEYPIPRTVWEKYISKKYLLENFGVTYKYVNMPKQETEYKIALRPFFASSDIPIKINGNNLLKKGYRQPTVGYNDAMFDYKVNRIAREKFRFIRDNDYEYQAYLEYWKGKAEQKQEMPVLMRINLLDEKKYSSYKNKARSALALNKSAINYVVPRKKRINIKERPSAFELWQVRKYEKTRCNRHLPLSPRHIRANDRIKRKGEWIVFGNGDICDNSIVNLPFYCLDFVQLSMF